MLGMQRFQVALLLILSGLSTAQAETVKFEGTAAIAAGAINPPDPVEGCNRAKRDAESKAANSGTVSFVSWERLSVDSDCSLTAPGARGVGYFFIFTARGNFKK